MKQYGPIDIDSLLELLSKYPMLKGYMFCNDSKKERYLDVLKLLYIENNMRINLQLDDYLPWDLL